MLAVEGYQNWAAIQGINSAFLQLSLFNLTFVIVEELIVKVCSAVTTFNLKLISIGFDPR